jgi:hypothetical protein
VPCNSLDRSACFEEPKERARVKKLMSREETLFPNFYDNIRRSLLPLMHEDATAIMRCYTQEALARSRKENHPKRKGPEKTPHAIGLAVDRPSSDSLMLKEASEEDLVRELARRKAESFRLSGAMKRSDDNDDPTGIPDPTGQVCTLNGGNGSIPCRELME